MRQARFGATVLLAGVLVVFSPNASATVALAPSGGSALPSQSISVTATITFGGNALPAGTWVLGFSGLPAGVTTVPAAPSYTILPAILGISATVTFQFSVGAGAVPGGPFIITVSDPATLTSKDFALTVLAPPDFALRLNPVSLSLPAGGSGITQVTVQPLSGFNGVVQVTAPTIPGITFSPANFSVVAGGTQPVTVAAAPGTPPQQLRRQLHGNGRRHPAVRGPPASR